LTLLIGTDKLFWPFSLSLPLYFNNKQNKTKHAIGRDLSSLFHQLQDIGGALDAPDDEAGRLGLTNQTKHKNIRTGSAHRTALRKLTS